MQLKKLVIELLRKLALFNAEICTWSGGIRVLVDSILDTSIADISESIVYTILYLINDPKLRCIISKYLDSPKLFSIFTDIE